MSIKSDLIPLQLQLILNQKSQFAAALQKCVRARVGWYGRITNGNRAAIALRRLTVYTHNSRVAQARSRPPFRRPSNSGRASRTRSGGALPRCERPCGGRRSTSPTSRSLGSPFVRGIPDREVADTRRMETVQKRPSVARTVRAVRSDAAWAGTGRRRRGVASPNVG